MKSKETIDKNKKLNKRVYQEKIKSNEDELQDNHLLDKERTKAETYDETHKNYTQSKGRENNVDEEEEISLQEAIKRKDNVNSNQKDIGNDIIRKDYYEIKETIGETGEERIIKKEIIQYDNIKPKSILKQPLKKKVNEELLFKKYFKPRDEVTIKESQKLTPQLTKRQRKVLGERNEMKTTSKEDKKIKELMKKFGPKPIPQSTKRQDKHCWMCFQSDLLHFTD